MSRNKLPDDPQAILQKELGDAYDFEPRDPMAGLTGADLSSDGSQQNQWISLIYMTEAGPSRTNQTCVYHDPGRKMFAFSKTKPKI